MRNTLWGAAAAAGLIAFLFVLSRIMPAAPLPAQQPAATAAAGPTAQEIAESVSDVVPGFVGRRRVGNWQVECAPKPAAPAASPPGAAKVPFTLNATGGGPATATPPSGATPDAKSDAQETAELAAKYGRCRTALVVRKRGNTKEVILIAVFRPMPGTDDVALILRYGPMSKPGGKVILALAKQRAVTLPVISCDKSQCMAFGVLRPNVYSVVAGQTGVEVVVPRASDGKRMIIPLSLTGLPESVVAIRRAG